MIDRLRARVLRWAAESPFFAELSAIRIALAIVVPFAAILWIVPIHSSFWLDETITYWTVRGTFDEMLGRAAHVTVGQPSLPFFVVMWLGAQIGAQMGGAIEVALRLPSEIAAFVAAIGVYRIALRAGDRFLALVALGIFVSYDTVRFAAADARPYALALAAVVWSVFMLVRWCDTAKAGYGIAYAALASLGFWFHFTSGVMFPLHLLYLLSRAPRERPSRGQLWIVAATYVVCFAPMASQVIQTWAERDLHSFASTPGTIDLLDTLVNVRLAVVAAIGLMVARALYPELSVRAAGAWGATQRFNLLWFAVPPVAFYIVAQLSDAKLFVPRYYIWGAPGFALFTASALAAIGSPRARHVVGVALLIGACMRLPNSGPAAHRGEDWRGALGAADAVMATGNAALLLQTNLTEDRYGPSLEPAGRSSPLLSPVTAYPVTGDLYLVPARLDDEVERRLGALVAARVAAGQRIVFVSRKTGVPTEAWLRGRLAAAGYAATSLGDFGSVKAMVFTRAGS